MRRFEIMEEKVWMSVNRGEKLTWYVTNIYADFCGVTVKEADETQDTEEGQEKLYIVEGAEYDIERFKRLLNNHPWR